MTQFAKPTPLVSPLFLKVVGKLKSQDISTLSATEATSGPLYSEWRVDSRNFDFPELSTLFRLSAALPNTLEELVQVFFKPAALTIIEVPDTDLLGDCETVLERGFLALARSKFDYLPKVRVISKGGDGISPWNSRRKKRDTGGIPSSLISQVPTVVLTEHRNALPGPVQSAATAFLTLPALSRDEINVLYRQIHDISLQAVLPDLLSNLPPDEALHSLSLETVYASLRSPSSSSVSETLWAAVNAKQIEEVSDALDQVIGLGPARAQLEQIAEDLRCWKSGNLPWEDVTRGVLLYGQPGTGKTFCAQKLAEQCGAHFVSGSYAEWQRHGHLGDMLAAMTESFKEARENAPSILFIDEVDAFGDRKSVSGDSAQYTRSVINALLEQLDGVGKQEGVLVVAACNFPELLDDALVRSGRFDLKIEMPLPDKAALVELLKSHLGMEVEEGPLASLALQLIGASGADIAALARKARAFSRQRKRVFSVSDLQEVVSASAPSISKSDLRRVALHEAGHAVVGFYSGKGQPLRARIGSTGGEVSFTSPNPLPEIADLEAEIATALAGRASEVVFFGAASAGAGGPEQSDLAKATSLAVSVESSYGMGASGLTWRPSTIDDLPALLTDQDLAQRVEARLQSALEIAKSLIVEHRHFVEGVAAQLVQQRELSSKDLSEILNRYNKRDEIISDPEADPKPDIPTPCLEAQA